MKSTAFSISHENFETILEYYNIINNISQSYFNKIQKYKDYTNEYCSKIKELFNEINELKDNDDYKTININLNGGDENNNLSIIKKIKVSPIKQSVININKFFNELIKYLDNFIKSLENPLNDLNEQIVGFNNEVNDCKTQQLKQQKNFFSNISEFKPLNSELKKVYNKAEKKLIEYCHEKRNPKYNNKDIEKLNNNLVISLSKYNSNEENILQKYNSIKNDFVKIFVESTNQRINIIKNSTSKLFQKYNIFLINIFPNFKNNFLIPLNQLMEEEFKFKEENQNENNVENEFDEVLNSYIQNIDEINYKINLEKYVVNVSDKNDNNKNKEELTKEEIFFIVKKMRDYFKLIDESKYNLDKEEKKIQLDKIVDKLISYAYCNKNKNEKNKDDFGIDDNYFNFLDMNFMKFEEFEKEKEKSKIKIKNKSDSKIILKEEKVSQEEIDILCKFMNNKEYINYFLLRINNFRTLGGFEMPLDKFNGFVQVFLGITKYLSDNLNNIKEKDTLDVNIAYLIIILSQTFYTMKDGKKTFIQKEISNENLFHKNEFWSLIIKISIEKEFENSRKNKSMNVNLKSEDKKAELMSTIAFAQIISYINGIIGFNIKKEEIKNIVTPFLDEYGISQENKDIINNMIEN